MKRNIYIFWNTKEDRPIICENNFGQMAVFTSIDNANASISNLDKSKFSIKSFEIK